MARGQRNNNKMTRRRKLQPAVMQMEFVVPTGVSYIDLNLCASLVNRRAYKQENTNWMVSGFEFLSFGPAAGIISIGKLQETWVTENAYTKAHALWKKMNRQVLDQNPDIQGKYSDFKVYLDADMGAQAIQTSNDSAQRILTPAIGGDWTQGNFDESADPKSNWDWSTIRVPNDPVSGSTAEYKLHMIGPNTGTSQGVIEGYALSRARPQSEDPNVPSTFVNPGDWMTALFDDGEQLDELKADLSADNDRPPYPVGTPGSSTEFYPGSIAEFNGLQVHGFGSFSSTTVSDKITIQGGMFGLGLMKVQNSTESSLSLLLHLVPGTHRGYMVEELC